MLYLTCGLDGNIYETKEGAGSLFEYILSAFALAQRYNLPFVFTSIKNIGHAIHNEIDQKEWDLQWNDYFKFILYDLVELPADVKTYKNSNLIFFLEPYRNSEDKICLDLGMSKKLQYIDMTLLDNIKEKLRDNYNQNTKVFDCYFDYTKVNVAIHIRRFTKTDCCNEKERELYTPESQVETFFSNVIKRIQILRPESIIHIYSQGKPEDFKNFNSLNVIMHLDEHPIISLHHMIKADILVMSKSSFSYIASIFSKGIKLMRANPIVPVLPEVKFIPEDGTSFDF